MHMIPGYFTARNAGVVERSQSTKIVVKTDEGSETSITLSCSRDVTGELYNQRPIVFVVTV
jgi:DNA-directed RNA polymerase subunit beta